MNAFTTLSFDHPPGDGPMTHPRTLLGAALLMLCSVSNAQDSTRADWLRNPAMGNYKAYAEFKMANYAAAREVWQTLAEVGNGDALFNLGVLAEDGLGEPRSMARAEALYTSAARAGNFKARYRLGMLYAAGTLLPRDVDKARLYLTLAAQGGDKDATATLATLGQPAAGQTPFQRAEYLSASGEHRQAAALYRELADQGDARAQTRLAWMAEAGRGTERDLDEAARRFEIAAQAGDAEAQYALAVMLRTGKGRERDVAQSLVWLQKAAAQKHPAAEAAVASSEAAGVR
jgi:TPR repeat protein